MVENQKKGSVHIGEILYHYCQADSFDKIISNRAVRLTDVRKSNDYGEVVGAGDVILKLFCNICQSYLTDQQIPEERFSPAERYVKSAYVRHCQICYWLAFCLTSLEDNLGQWREYGRNAGYAIGFDAEYLRRKAEEHRCYHFSPIIYWEANDIKNFYSIAEDLMRTLIRTEERAGLNNRSGKLRPDVKQEINQWLYRVIDKMPFYKSKDFEAEKETRFCYVRTVFPQQFDCISPESSLNNFDCMINGTEAKMYLTFPFDPEAVKAIWIGPKVNVSVNEMRVYLAIKGFDSNRIDIHKSKITMQ